MFIHLVNTENSRNIFILAIAPEEIPLNASHSENRRTNQTPGQSRLNYDLAVNDAERRLLNVTHPPAIDCTRLRTSNHQKSPFQNEANDKNVSQLDTQQGRKRSIGNLRDINAMSVASIYDREHNEIMDADK